MPPPLVTPPEWIDLLPRDHRGFPVPAESGWRDGKPEIEGVNTERKIMLARQRACAVCGFPIPAEATVYRAFAQADAAKIRLANPSWWGDPSGPLHRSCILYSAMTCPYLREKTARLGTDSGVNPGAPRGALAAVMGFRGVTMLVGQRANGALPRIATTQESPVFLYIQLIDDIRYRNGSELAQLYEEAVHADRAVIDMDGPRWYWAAVPNATLKDGLLEAMKAICARPPAFPETIAARDRANTAFPI